MKRLVAAGLTGLLLFVVLRTNTLPRSNELPDSSPAGSEVDPLRTVERAFLTAEQGDVDGYLALFAGSLRTQVERELKLQGRDNYRATLRQNSAGLKGRVIEPVTATSQTSEVDVRVERIYAHHHERQSYRLRRDGAAWRIFELGPIERFQPSVPYGTPVWGK